MIRFLILLAVGYGLYRALKSWTAPHPQGKMDGRGQDRIDDVMVKDPVCQVYFPQREGIRWSHDGSDYFFCSQACLEKFKLEQSINGK